MLINGKREKQQVCSIEYCRGCDYESMKDIEQDKGSLWEIVGGLALVGIIIIVTFILI
jgi:hypothetical protein